MSESLIPERPVQFSPSLAAVIGVEEAILLQHIQIRGELSSLSSDVLPLQLRRQRYQWIQTSLAELSQQLPFWQPSAIRRLANNLNELGMLAISESPHSADVPFYCAIAQDAPPHAASRSQDIASNTTLGAQKISSHWRPDAASYSYLDNLGIPRAFSQAAVEEFILYWRERNEASHAWSNKFAQHVARRWQSEQQLAADRTRQGSSSSEQNAASIQQQWQPSQDAIEILERMGIHKNFVIDAIPEFVLYWRERGESKSTWNSKFVAHTKRQWARYTNTLKHDTEPRAIGENWRPDEEVFEVLALANIDRKFAVNLIPEFVMYWRDRGELNHSWNTKFLQYVKYQWSKQYFSVEANTSGQNRPTPRARKTRDVSLAERLTDRSWAE